MSLLSCINNGKSALTEKEEDNFDTYMAVGDYLLVNGRPPKDKEDFIKFLKWREEDFTFYKNVLSVISDEVMNFEDSDTLCSFTLNGFEFYNNYKRKDGIYCGQLVCDSLEYLRKQLTEVKLSFSESISDSLAKESYYFKYPLWYNNTRDVIFIKENDRFILVQSGDSLHNWVNESFCNRIPNQFLELGVDSLVVMMYQPYYSEFGPPPPPPW